MTRSSLLLVLMLSLFAASAHAETRRLAVVVGNNVGNGARAPLRFAENDAQKLANVLTDLGGAAPQDVLLLEGQSLAAVDAALSTAAARVARWRERGGVQVVVIFYFSGHSDGHALELGRERLPFGELRRRLRAIDADLRVVVVDTCRSGNMLAVKGGTLGPTFDLALTNDVTSNGEVLITSSAADESALESAEIGGSYFSHHLVSGLRGAADASGDGLVTLGEAYQYAFARTVSATAETTIGPQHPIYDYRLSGRGDLVLTQVSRPSAILDVPPGFERLLVIDERSARVVAELGASSARRLALRPGAYLVRARRADQRYGARVSVSAGRVTLVRAEDLTATSDAPSITAKGDGSFADDGHGDRRTRLTIAAGIRQALTTGVGLLPTLRIGVARAGSGAWTLFAGAEAATGRTASVRETHAQIMAAAYLSARVRRLELLLGPELAVGLAMQSIDAQGASPERTRTSWLASASPTARVALHIGRTSWGVTGRAGAAWLERDGVSTRTWMSSVLLDAWMALD